MLSKAFFENFTRFIWFGGLMISFSNIIEHLELHLKQSIRSVFDRLKLFTKAERNNEWNGNFLQNSLISIPLAFSLVKAPLKCLFWCSVKLYYHISFNIRHIMESLPWNEMKFKKKSQGVRSSEYRGCYCFTKNCLSKCNGNRLWLILIAI